MTVVPPMGTEPLSLPTGNAVSLFEAEHVIPHLAKDLYI